MAGSQAGSPASPPSAPLPSSESVGEEKRSCASAARPLRAAARSGFTKTRAAENSPPGKEALTSWKVKPEAALPVTEAALKKSPP